MTRLGKLKDSTRELGNQNTPSSSNLSLNRIRRIVEGGGTLTDYPDAGIVVSTGTAWGTSVANNSTNWNTAFGWGNHALAGYLTSESDPVFSASVAFGITSGNITNWNTAYSWGNHSGLYQALDGDLTAIAALSGTSGLLRKTGANTWTLDASAYTFQHSLSEAGTVVNLVNDAASPGNSKLYGTNSSGVRGWYDIPTAGVPDAHASTHQNAGADEISVAGLSGLLADPQTPISHAVNASTYGYGDGTVAGHVRVGTGLNVATGTISVAYGNSAGTACIGNDSRLSNARTPVAHQLDSATYHTVSGLTTGHFLRAASPTAFAFSALLKTDVLPLLSDWFTLEGSAPNQYIRCKYPFAGDYDIQAWSDTGWLPPTIWEAMPSWQTVPPSGITSETDPIFTAHTAYGISSTNVSNWNTAYSWGNHAGLYSAVSHNHSGTYFTSSEAITLTNKTINATNNTITDTGTAAGDILKSNGTKFVRLARGTALQFLRVNSAGTDLEYAFADTVKTTNFTITQESGKLVIKYGSTVIASISSTGAITSADEIEAFGTP